MVQVFINGFEHRGVSLANYKVNPKHYEFDYCFKRLKESSCKLKWKWLSDFCNENNVKICISSVWKNNFKDTDNDWNRTLINFGFEDGIYVGITGHRQTLRGDEIKDWMQGKDIESYAIIDDDSDMLPEQMSSFFIVDGYYGLTPNIIYRIGRHFHFYK